MDNDNGKRFHVTLNAYDRRALEFVRGKVGGNISMTKAIVASVRAAAIQLGFNGAMEPSQEIFKTPPP
jgi:hypothetical protein